MTPASQKRLVLVGATGMVGGYALRYALKNSAVESVTAIVRRKLGISNAKLREVLHLTSPTTPPSRKHFQARTRRSFVSVSTLGQFRTQSFAE
jgi:thioester reductase-like protein